MTICDIQAIVSVKFNLTFWYSVFLNIIFLHFKLFEGIYIWNDSENNMGNIYLQVHIHRVLEEKRSPNRHSLVPFVIVQKKYEAKLEVPK